MPDDHPPLTEDYYLMADAAALAFGNIAPLLHPEVAAYIHSLTGQVLWLHKELAAVKERLRG